MLHLSLFSHDKLFSQRLRQSKPARTLLSGDGGILSIEQHSSTRRK
ncbi:hypothetical protein GO685_03300 [Wolbachia endosymbiont of Madathamugadia hiepei]|nr:hypothetical protein [Wolbachia endosymbiont of Madathamugadia hiepei]NUX01512.1 hypothetical protein [Wolbachia endosymbiont of Madathamugadia hiepei]